MRTAAAGQDANIAAFEKFASFPKVEFWSQLEKKKIHELKLSAEPVGVTGMFHSARDASGGGGRVELTGESFAAKPTLGAMEYRVPGRLVNFNTIEEYNANDAKQALKEMGDAMWSVVTTRAWLEDPALLLRFAVYSFADLKLHRFHYRAALPILSPADPIRAEAKPRPIGDAFDAAAVKSLREVFEVHRGIGADANPDEAAANWHHCPIFAVRWSGSAAQMVPLSSVTRDDAAAVAERRLTFCVADPCANPAFFGWGARNLLLAVAVTFGFKDRVTLISYREGVNGIGHSLVGTFRVPIEGGLDAAEPPVARPASVKVFGWETQKPVVDLASSMDPSLLAEESAKLNLSLMKWRMTPNLDLAKIAGQRCLLVGSGTLGCGVARNLMKWGVFHITFIDRGNVSYSNPVRQSLFVHDDAVHKRNKAQAAADGCKRVYPLCKATAVEMNVPMPGHAVTAAQAADVKATVEKFEKLIQEHDVIFLLTDSRESRWLPTLLGARHRKLVLNAALGFDSYLALRHGCPGTPEGAERLGCYFCTDVTSPSDSLSDRTLDQQCTVTRPGVSDIASAFIVEMLASLVSHPRGTYAPVPTKTDDNTGVLGTVPHQVRGGLYHFDQMAIKGAHYSQCVACSDAILGAYHARGFDFLMEVFNNADVLAQTSGISAMLKAIDEGDCDIISDDEEFD